MQNKNFRLFVQNSCSDAVTQDKEYMKLQSDYVLAKNAGDTGFQEEIQCEMEAKSEEICFMAGFRAAMQFILNEHLNKQIHKGGIMPENKDFIEFIYIRIEKTLINDPDYIRLQEEIIEAQKSGDNAKYENLVADIESRAEILCYNQGLKDGIALGSGKGL